MAILNNGEKRALNNEGTISLLSPIDRMPDLDNDRAGSSGLMVSLQNFLYVALLLPPALYYAPVATHDSVPITSHDTSRDLISTPLCGVLASCTVLYCAVHQNSSAA